MTDFRKVLYLRVPAALSNLSSMVSRS